MYFYGIHCILLQWNLSVSHYGVLLCSSSIYWISGRYTSTFHYDDVIMSAIASQITSLTIVYSIVYSDADQRYHQSSASLAFVWGIHRGPVNSPQEMASYAENVSIWWRHHAKVSFPNTCYELRLWAFLVNATGYLWLQVNFGLCNGLLS